MINPFLIDQKVLPKRNSLCKYYILFSLLALFNLSTLGQKSCVLEVDKNTFGKEIILKNNSEIEDGKVELFIYTVNKEDRAKNLSLEIIVPACVEIYDEKYLHGNKTESGIFPFSFLEKVERNKINYQFPRREEINWNDTGYFYFFIVPVQMGNGKILARYSWYDEYGNYYENETTGGNITVL